MKRFAWVMAVMATALPHQGDAQDDRRFFKDSRINYWGRAEAKKTQAITPLWKERQDGSPPEVLTRFLNNPTRSNAQAYLSWQRQRLSRIAKAQEMLAQMQRELKFRGLALRIRNFPAEILHFSKPGCPFCKRQRTILEELTELLPDLNVRHIDIQERPELARNLRIAAVPTLIVRAGDSERRHEGLANLDVLSALIADVIELEKERNR